MVAVAHTWVFSAEEHAFGYYAVDPTTVSVETGLSMAVEALEGNGRANRSGPEITNLIDERVARATDEQSHSPHDTGTADTDIDANAEPKAAPVAAAIEEPVQACMAVASASSGNAPHHEGAHRSPASSWLLMVGPLGALGTGPPSCSSRGSGEEAFSSGRDGGVVFLHRRVVMGPSDAAVRAAKTHLCDSALTALCAQSTRVPTVHLLHPCSCMLKEMSAFCVGVVVVQVHMLGVSDLAEDLATTAGSLPRLGGHALSRAARWGARLGSALVAVASSLIFGPSGGNEEATAATATDDWLGGDAQNGQGGGWWLQPWLAPDGSALGLSRDTGSSTVDLDEESARRAANAAAHAAVRAKERAAELRGLRRYLAASSDPSERLNLRARIALAEQARG